jgi:di/tricarboxylate transporter
MTVEGLIVLAILVISVVLFASERFRVDFIALGIMITLMVLGIVTPQEAVSGFVNSATVTIAAMFVLSAGLQRAGALNRVGSFIKGRVGTSEIQAILVFMVTAAILSAFMLNTAVVAVFIPIAIMVAKDADIAPSRILMPLSFGAMLGGTLTLIGTSTNLLVNGIAIESGLPSFNMFDFAPLGIIVLLVGIVYMMTLGRRLLPKRYLDDDLLNRFGLREYLSEVVVLENSRLVGKRLGDSGLGQRFDITVLDIFRDGRTIQLPGARRYLRPGDVILVRASLEDLLEIRKSEGLELVPAREHGDDVLGNENEVGMAEAVVASGSPLIGYSLKEVNFRQRYGATTIGIQRHGQPMYSKLGHQTMMTGDVLLVLGRKQALREMQMNTDFIMISDVPMPKEQRNAPLAILIMLGVVIVTMFGLLPIMAASLIGAFLMVATRVLDLDEAYAALDKRVLVMLGSILSLEAAMANSGLAEWGSHVVVDMVGQGSPWLLVGVFYLMAMLLTEAMSNQATAVVLAPLAITTAAAIGADPTPLLMAITFAASASFMTPIGYQTNTMIYGAGNYRFFDFTRVGAPLNLLLWIASTIAIPFIWPLF